MSTCDVGGSSHGRGILEKFRLDEFLRACWCEPVPQSASFSYTAKFDSAEGDVLCVGFVQSVFRALQIFPWP